MSASSVVLAEAIRHIREVALRDAMAMVSRLQPSDVVDWSGDQETYRLGHRHARMEVYAEIERMIAREAPVPPTQAGYTSDGMEDG